MKKALVLLIVLAFVLNLFACSAEKEQNGSTVSTNSTAVESTSEESPIEDSIPEVSSPDENSSDESKPDDEGSKDEEFYFVEYWEDELRHHKVKFLYDKMIIEPTGRKTLTLEKVLEIASKRGEEVSWVDFEDYKCDQHTETEITYYTDASENNIDVQKHTLVSMTRYYSLNSGYLTITGKNIASDPESITLSFLNKDKTKRYDYDIRNGDLENVLKNGINLPEGENVKFETKAYRDVPEIIKEIKKFNEEYNKQITSSSVALIENYNELSDLCHRLWPNWEEDSNLSEPIKQLLNDYDESFFENRVLIIAGVEAGSGSNKYSVSNVRMLENSIYVDVRSTYPKGASTDDNVNWILSVSISRSEIENVENIYANHRWSYYDGEKSPYMEFIEMPYKK